MPWWVPVYSGLVAIWEQLGALWVRTQTSPGNSTLYAWVVSGDTVYKVAEGKCWVLLHGVEEAFSLQVSLCWMNNDFS